MSLFAELKRRNVFKVGIAYGVASWLLLQLTDILVPILNLPESAARLVFLLLLIGFIPALILAWAFEMTPAGIRREKDIDRTQSITSQTGRKLDRVIIGFLALAVLVLLADRFYGTDPEPVGGRLAAESRAERAPTDTESANALVGGRSAAESAAKEATTAGAKSIAVLPFADLSQAGDQAWFADGLAEEILNTLAKTPDLLVASRTSSFRYKGSTLDLRQIAAELGVAHVLEGSVRSAGNRIRVTAQLIRASDGFHLWSENYDRDVADMIAIQEDLARNIAQALETTMDPAALAEMTRAGTRSVAAYQDYLRGLSLIAESAIQDTRQLYVDAYDLFEKARTTDANFAAAHMMAADFWKTQLSPSRTDSGQTDIEPLQMLAKFNERIDRAIATAPTEVDRKGYLAYRALFDLRLREAIRLFREYLQARPNDEQAWFSLQEAAALASDRSALQQAFEHFKELGQTDANAATTYVNGAYRYSNTSLAADYGLQALTRWPTHLDLLYQTHRTLLWAGRNPEARQMADRYRQLNPAGSPILEARQACAEGRTSDVEALLAGMNSTGGYDRTVRWHLLKLLGREAEAVDILRPYADTGVAYQMADWLTYHQFDPGPFPSVMAVLEREGVERPPAAEIPFKCPPAPAALP